MKRNLKIFIGILMLLSFNQNVKASSCSVSASNTSVIVGSKITIYIRGNDAIGRFNINSSNTSVLSGATSAWVENNQSPVTFTANKIGTSTISVSPQAGLSNSNGDEINIGCNSVTINVIEKKSTQGSTNNISNNTNNKNNNSNTSSNSSKKSSNNYLKELKVENAKLEPEFDKGTTEYNVTVSKDTEKIKIIATKDDEKANLSGDGEKSVSEGMNKFEIVVTAENGYKKTYILNVEVQEEPLTVKYNDQDLNVIKKENAMPEIPNYYDKTTIKINDIEIPAYKGSITNYLLVGLKDKDGNVNLYIYNEKNNQYTLYNEIKFNQLSIVIKDFPKSKIPSNYKLYKETINDKEINVYKLSKNSNYSLIYGINIETGKENIYKYEKQENTIQTFEREEQEKLEKETEQYKKLIIILVVVIIFLILLLTISLTKAFTKNKNKKTDDELTKKDIKKIEKETKRMKKKNKEKEAEL